MPKRLDTPIRYLKGIGPKRAEGFARVGIHSIEDLLYYFPRRYEDRRQFSSIAELKEGQTQTIKARIINAGNHQSFRRRGFNIIQALVGDQTGRITCVWFNQPYLKNYLKVGNTLILYGKVDNYKGRLQMSSPEFEVVSEGEGDDPLSVGRVVPVYSLPEGLRQRALRQVVRKVLDEYLTGISDFLHYDIRSKNNLMNLPKSLVNIHFPEDPKIQQEAYRRLSFEEFFLFQIPLAIRKLSKDQKKGIAHIIDPGAIEEFIKGFSFELTGAQKKVIDEIKQDMITPKPMQRLLQGDVASGKTVVALVASMMAIQGGYQVAFMVPIEILAQQHFKNIAGHFRHTTAQGKKINTALLTGSQQEKQRQEIYNQIKDGQIDLVIGTHALLEEKVKFGNLGLVIIDEQHKFGVGQRALLPKKGKNPDVLIMTATPIPRTLAITLYGDLDISVINELPPGRKPITTEWIDNTKREWMYSFIREKISSGQQVYIICPLIEESSALDLLSAKKMHKQLQGLFGDLQVGLIHGALKAGQQQKVIESFKSKKCHILVATTILEVGIDIPNATVMVVEQAERFGLSQLHQLRGRIGRGARESFCILVSDSQAAEAQARLKAMISFSDGFRISEEDLKIRGPGEFFGRHQHGLTELKIGDPLTQMQLLKRARQEALKLIREDPHLEEKKNLTLKKKLLQRFPEYEKLMVVG